MVNAAEAYKRQQILTATPEQLTLMLYNGCLKFIGEGIDAVSAKKYEAGNTALQKAQRIISEFRLTLNMDYEISHQLFPLYNYVYDRLKRYLAIGRSSRHNHRAPRRLGRRNEEGASREGAGERR